MSISQFPATATEMNNQTKMMPNEIPGLFVQPSDHSILSPGQVVRSDDRCSSDVGTADVYDSLVLPDVVDLSIHRYLRLADRLLPGRIVGLYVVGSVALGGFRAGRSDIDFVAVLDRRLSRAELGRLRLLHLITAGRTGCGSVYRGASVFSGTCNGVFVIRDDLKKPVSDIAPVASQTGIEFSVERAFDVNPVGWKILAERGITVRGEAPANLGLSTQAALLRAWNQSPFVLLVALGRKRHGGWASLGHLVPAEMADRVGRAWSTSASLHNRNW